MTSPSFAQRVSVSLAGGFLAAEALTGYGAAHLAELPATNEVTTSIHEAGTPWSREQSPEADQLSYEAQGESGANEASETLLDIQERGRKSQEAMFETYRRRDETAEAIKKGRKDPSVGGGPPDSPGGNSGGGPSGNLAQTTRGPAIRHIRLDSMALARDAQNPAKHDQANHKHDPAKHDQANHKHDPAKATGSNPATTQKSAEPKQKPAEPAQRQAPQLRSAGSGGPTSKGPSVK